MIKSRNKLYVILFTACLLAYLWLYFNYINHNKTSTFTICYFKNITNLPCPSCGATRSIISLSKGNFNESVITNPLGLLMSAFMIIIPLWIVIDVITKSNSLYNFYNKVEIALKKPKFYIPLIILILINWIWNIKKHL